MALAERANSQSIVTRDLVLEATFNAKTESSRPSHYPVYLSRALDPQLLSKSVRRGDQDLNEDVRANRRRDRAVDQRPFQRNVARKAGAVVLALFLPVEDHRQLTGIAHSRFVRLFVIRDHEQGFHRLVPTMPERNTTQQEPERLKNEGAICIGREESIMLSKGDSPGKSQRAGYRAATLLEG
jgi:hypothetical protein